MAKSKNGALVLGAHAKEGAPAASRLSLLSAGAPILADAPASHFQGGLTSANNGYNGYEAGVAYPVGAHIEIPLDLVIDDPLQPRVYYPEEDLQELKTSISSNGQLTPIQVYPADETGKFMTRSGHRRRRVFKLLHRTTIRAEIVARSDTPFADYRKAREINLQQKSHTYIDDAVRFRELIKLGWVATQEALAQELDEAQSHVSKCLSVGTLPGPVLSAMAEKLSVFGLSSAYSVYRYWQDSGEDEISTLKLVEDAIQMGLSVRKLDALIASKLANAPKKRRDRAMSRAVFTGPASGELKAFEGKLTLRLNNLTEQNRSAFFQKLLGVFQELGLKVDSAASP